MLFPHLTSELIDRVERFGSRFHAARMTALIDLPGNPYQVEVRQFGEKTTACKTLSPLLRSRNRVLGFSLDDQETLSEVLAFYRSDDLRCSLTIAQGQMTAELFARLSEAGLWSGGSGTVPVYFPDGGFVDCNPTLPQNIVIRVSDITEKEAYLDLFQRAFAHRGECDPAYREIQWSEDSLPGGVRYIAEIDGFPVAMASFPISEGIGYCGTAGVIPEFRGRGIHLSLIRRRIADAPLLGCNLLIGGGSPGTTTYRNFERAGLRLIPAGMGWADGRI